MKEAGIELDGGASEVLPSAMFRVELNNGHPQRFEVASMTIPDRVTADWIATLANDRLVTVESRLHSAFITEDQHERKRSGGRYALLQGPAALVNAWVRWQMVNTEARSRGLLVRRVR